MTSRSIKILSEDVVSRIAAGEVVERPASVVKELLENSIDSGASAIHIFVTGGGLEAITVVDNGSGIDSSDVSMAFTRFATSKIVTFDDLERIGSLGFRGEALYSISSVSELTIITKTSQDNVGTKAVVNNGELVSHGAVASNQGTLVTVSGLFKKFPARKKFLKSSVAESGRIRSIVQKYAMICPSISFDLRQDIGRNFMTSGSGDLRYVMGAIYGQEFASDMIAIPRIHSEQDRIEAVVNGIIGIPSQNRANRSHINLFVNGRWVQNKTINYALEQAYRGFLPERRFPVGMIDLTLSPDQVDVNVHPAKTELRFVEENQVFSLVQKTARDCLLEFAPIPVIKESNANLVSSKIVNQYPVWPTPLSTTVISENEVIVDEVQFLADHAQSFDQMGNFLRAGSPSQVLPILRVIGQIRNTYIITEGPDGLYLIDQHAAHERIIFEELIERAKMQDQSQQTLMEPIVVDLNDLEIVLIEENDELFKALGMDIELFGPSSYLIRTIPTVLSQADPSKALKEVLDVLGEGIGFETWEEKAAYSVACHAAIRAGKKMSFQEMQVLIRQLENCTQPNTCPHGRPTTIHFSPEYLDSKFGRR
jgi:DNA mismatch repair protein MutL